MIATRPYRRTVDDHRKAACSLRRYGARVASGFAPSRLLHHLLGHDHDLRRLGRVRHLISPNQFHYAHIAEWEKVFPDAIAWASPGVRRRARARHNMVVFARELGAVPPVEWRGDMDQTLFPGGYFKEFIFFHEESKTLILTDTIMNMELDKIGEPWRTTTRLTRMSYPDGQIFFGMRVPLMLHRRQAEAALSKIRFWQPKHVVLSHGRCFDADTEEITRRISGAVWGRST